MGAERGMRVSECNRLRTHEGNVQVQVQWQSEGKGGGISVEGGVCGGVIDDVRLCQAGKQFIHPSNRPSTAEGSSIACTRRQSRSSTPTRQTHPHPHSHSSADPVHSCTFSTPRARIRCKRERGGRRRQSGRDTSFALLAHQSSSEGRKVSSQRSLAPSCSRHDAQGSGEARLSAACARQQGGTLRSRRQMLR